MSDSQPAIVLEGTPSEVRAAQQMLAAHGIDAELVRPPHRAWNA